MRTTPKKYFEKNGCIYGISTKYAFGRWDGYARVFYSLEDAYHWLHTEEYDFRERELVTKTEAMQYGILDE